MSGLDLSQPTYGIHGTATPSKLFVNQSHGCVRLTNWDAWELAHMVKARQTTVEFLDPGVSIADVTGAAAAAAVAPAAAAAVTATAIGTNRPPARGDRIPPPSPAPSRSRPRPRQQRAGRRRAGGGTGQAGATLTPAAAIAPRPGPTAPLARLNTRRMSHPRR